MNIGSSNRLLYDPSTYSDRLSESTAPLMYNMDIHANVNCNTCIPQKTNLRSTGYIINNDFPNVIDTESILTNRNMIASKSRMAEVNTFDIDSLAKKQAGMGMCNDKIIPIQTHLEMPPYGTRELLTDRFIDLPKNPQINIFWDFAINTQLEAKDNFVQKKQKMIDPYLALPPRKKSNYFCDINCGKR
jgi:hypothetical protein